MAGSRTAAVIVHLLNSCRAINADNTIADLASAPYGSMNCLVYLYGLMRDLANLGCAWATIESRIAIFVSIRDKMTIFKQYPGMTWAMPVITSPYIMISWFV